MKIQNKIRRIKEDKNLSNEEKENKIKALAIKSTGSFNPQDYNNALTLYITYYDLLDR